jgi:hypothetical protein
MTIPPKDDVSAMAQCPFAIWVCFILPCRQGVLSMIIRMWFKEWCSVDFWKGVWSILPHRQGSLPILWWLTFCWQWNMVHKPSKTWDIGQ